ncbi:hypothetical protein AB0M22_31380 [Nocardia sp. NPDC051756]|uniref:hypothetical protein n=1 Tax=Nocardia sp. NPDC051756 TaxID=3154751 RepID=UPI003446FAF5
MDIVVVLVTLAIGAIVIWGAISVWTEDTHKRNHPDRTPCGFRGDDDESGR